MKLLSVLWFCLALVAGVWAAERPNFVLIFVDDMGYGDLSCYGQTAYQTPRLDKMAREGVRFSDFLVASPGCSPSRAAILTGCQPVRLSLPGVLGPNSKTGLNPDEETLPELLKDGGYKTAMAGKWHIGVKNLMPLTHGFDSYLGTPYSNDMWPKNGKTWPDLYWYRDNKAVEIIDSLKDQAKITSRLTDFSVKFIEDNKEEPFFLYVAHPMPHVPIAASEKFLGQSGAGLYGDTIQEIDWSVGQILDALKANGVDENTLVFFTSDNGPWLPYGNHGGSSGGLREGKGSTFEGGMRVPAIARWPGKLPAGRVCNSLSTALDVLPTFVNQAEVSMPKAKIDGHDAWRLWSGQTEVSPTKYFPYYLWPGELQAIRVRQFKLHFEHTHRHQKGEPGKDGRSAGQVHITIPESLFNLDTDLAETTDVSDQYPEMVKRLKELADSVRAELGDTKTKTKGSGVRPAGKVESNSPHIF